MSKCYGLTASSKKKIEIETIITETDIEIYFVTT